MSNLNEAIGELFMVGFAGTEPTAARELIREYHVGGIILFSRNIKDAEHLRSLCGKLQELRREVSDSPLFIAIDQEGGCVARITEDVTVFPGNMALGAIGSEPLARRTGEVTAAELSALGINVNFAPVLDINSNLRNPGIGARSFGSDPALAAHLGSAMITGMQENGINATAKHFPGLGEAQVDSHDELPLVDASRDQLEKREIVPFRAAISAGVTFVMTAHCSYSSLDSTLAPATLSKPILTDLLHRQMGFEGIVITDCLEMAAIEKNRPAPQAALEAIAAGATMALICHTKQKQIAAIESLTHAVENGKLSREAIDAASEIISNIKGRVSFAGSSLEGKIVPSKSLSETVATEAVSIIRNEDSTIPLRLEVSEKLAVIVPAFEALTKVEEDAEPHRVLLEEIGQRHRELLYRKVAVEPSADEISECMEICRGADMLLILTYNLHRYPSQGKLVGALLGVGKRSVVAAVRDPYDLAFVPKANACVATYSFRECSLKALARILFGEAEARGKSPIKFN